MLLLSMTGAAALAAGYAPPPGVRSHLFQASAPRILILEGSPPAGVSNGNNHGALGVRVYERPHHQPFAAVAAQEIFEWQYEQELGPRAALRKKRPMELASHAVESLVAHRFYGFELDFYERWEAASMTRYPHLKGMSEAEIAAAMRAARPQAQTWVEANRGLIEKLVAYQFPRR